jgi:hypothetical protein
VEAPCSALVERSHSDHAHAQVEAPCSALAERSMKAPDAVAIFSFLLVSEFAFSLNEDFGSCVFSEEKFGFLRGVCRVLLLFARHACSGALT